MRLCHSISTAKNESVELSADLLHSGLCVEGKALFIPSTRPPFTNCRGSAPERPLRLESSMMSPLIRSTSGVRCQGGLESLSSIDQTMIFALLRVADNVTLTDDYVPYQLYFVFADRKGLSSRPEGYPSSSFNRAYGRNLTHSLLLHPFAG